jgi:hypothetical protein
MAASTRAQVSGRTEGWPFRTRDTVTWDTPASRATSPSFPVAGSCLRFPASTGTCRPADVFLNDVTVQNCRAAATMPAMTWRIPSAAPARSGWPASSQAMMASVVTTGASWAAHRAQAGLGITVLSCR